MRKKNGRIYPLKGLLILLLGFLSILILGYLAFFSTIFSIKQVILLNEYNQCSEGIDETYIVGENIFFLDEGQLKTTLKNQDFCFKDVKINKNLPDRITLYFIKRVAVAKVISSRESIATSASIIVEATLSGQLTDTTFLLDEEGIVFSQASNEVLPRIVMINQEVNIGDSLDPEKMKKIILIFDKGNQLNLDIKEAKLTKQNHLIAQSLGFNFIVAFNLEEEINEQLASLQLILDKSKINDEKIEYLDLRYSNPIVKYAPRKK